MNSSESPGRKKPISRPGLGEDDQPRRAPARPCRATSGCRTGRARTELSIDQTVELAADDRRRRLALARRPTAPISTTSAAAGDGEAGAVVVLQADDRRQDQQRHQVHHLDQRVERRAGGVLERVADGVADDRGLVGLGALAALVAVLDVLLGVVPRATGVGQVVGHQLAGEDDARRGTRRARGS